VSNDSQGTASLDLAYRLYDLGDLEACSEQLAKVHPDPEREEVYFYLKGLIHFARQERTMALNCFERVLEANPDLSEAHRALGLVQESAGNLTAAAQHYCMALDRMPDDTVVKRNLLHVLEQFKWTELLREAVKERIRQHLSDAFTDVELDLTRYKTVILLAVASAPHFQDALRFVREQPRRQSGVLQSQSFFEDILNDPLIWNCLSSDILPMEVMELVFTEIRRELLFYARDPFLEPEMPLSFVTALATQAYMTEYAYAVSTDEELEVQELINSVSEELKDTQTLSSQHIFKLAVSAAYISLGDWLADIPRETFPSELRELYEIQILNPRIERVLINDIDDLQPSIDDTSRVVREQYEQNPFPRWNSLRTPEATTVGKWLKNLFPYFEPTPNFFEPCSILIAGCGTGHQPITEALRFPESEIVAIDLSRRSLAYAARMASQYEISNIRFLEADILALDSLDMSFDVIECTGVLHHMADPYLGGHCLLNKLVPGGVIKLALYSEIARRKLAVAQRWINEKKLEPKAETIRETRHHILSLPPEDPMRDALGFVDFYSLSGARDLLFHVHETAFIFPQIDDALNHWGIDLIGLQLLEPQVAKGFKEMFPSEESLLDLQAWHQFEMANPDSFRQMYTLWCQKPPG